MHLSRERFSAQTWHCHSLFQKRTIEDPGVSKMRVAPDALGWLRHHGPRDYDQRSRTLRYGDLQIALPHFSHLRRIAELAAALAAEALIARCRRGFHEIVVSILLRDLVDDARTLVEELLLAAVLLHALEDEL